MENEKEENFFDSYHKARNDLMNQWQDDVIREMSDTETLPSEHPFFAQWINKEEALLMFPDKTLLVSSGDTLKKNMLDFLSKAQLPLYFDEKELIREFIETFFKSLEKSNT